MHPTTPQRLKERQATFQSELDRIERLAASSNRLSDVGLRLICGCKIESYDMHGIIVTYCGRHKSFTFSPRMNGTDVFYFIDEEQRP